MSSIYDKASLVLIPSGTKTSKVFSQKPVNGDGDFTFSRSTAATRVNADGNIEKETQNLFTYSNTFTSWIKSASGVTLTSGQSGYDGSSDAYQIEKDASAFRFVRQDNTSPTGVITFSVYMKAGTLTTAAIRLLSSPDARAKFNLSTGALMSSSNVIDTSSEDVGSGWYRYSMTANMTTMAEQVIYPDDITTSNAGTIFVQDAQLEQGLVARDYIETTTAAVEGGITDNVPRLDYTDSSCPALLLEPQRRNLVDSSEYLGSLTGVTASYVESPEGLNNATRLTENTATSQHYSSINVSGIVSGQTYALSFYIRKGTYNNVLVYTQSVKMSSTVSITFSTETISVGGAVAGSPFMNSVGNGWYRCGWVGTAIGSGDMYIYATVLNLNSGVGDGTSYIDYYGFQVEDNGAGGGTTYATSYIPTYGTSVTRNGDDCSKTGISDLIGQTEGTWFLDYVYLGLEAVNQNWFALQNTSGSDRIHFYSSGNSNQLRFLFVANGSALIDNSGVIEESSGTRYKVAVSYKSGAISIYINGIEIVSYNTAFTFGNEMSLFTFKQSNQQTAARVNQTLLLKTALTDQEAIDLTTI